MATATRRTNRARKPAEGKAVVRRDKAAPAAAPEPDYMPRLRGLLAEAAPLMVRRVLDRTAAVIAERDAAANPTGLSADELHLVERIADFGCNTDKVRGILPLLQVKEGIRTEAVLEEVGRRAQRATSPRPYKFRAGIALRTHTELGVSGFSSSPAGAPFFVTALEDDRDGRGVTERIRPFAGFLPRGGNRYEPATEPQVGAIVENLIKLFVD